MLDFILAIGICSIMTVEELIEKLQTLNLSSKVEFQVTDDRGVYHRYELKEAKELDFMFSLEKVVILL